MLSLKIATPATILNYANLLEENKYYEDSFRAYEKGIALFPWPHVKEIWVHYLHKFVQRYEGDKLDRGRELFEEALADAPADMSKTLYLMYSNFEENYGLTKRAMSILDRMCSSVQENERHDMYILYISKVEKYYGVARTREVYEKGIEKLDDTGAKSLCLLYAEMERNLGEIDRARAILRHGSQFANPRVSIRFWKAWHEFEVVHGNEDTFREMLRVKRSVQTQYASEGDSGAAGNIFAFQKASDQQTAEIGADGIVDNDMSEARLKSLGMDAEDLAEAVTNLKGGEEVKKRKAVEIDPGEEEAKIKRKVDDKEEQEMEIDLEEQAVPASVFGDAIAKAQEEEESQGHSTAKKKLGALARFQQR
mmetsp:Transcript_10176/g.11756  ORF Transcript_10176/g.11756 Transcript_10176/m.11756 type:complete len:365 (+) Transcript_10176:79-1173(+)